MRDRVLKSIEIQGFKCFCSLKLEFGKLTLITGVNGGGKSSSIQPLLLIAQAFRGGFHDQLPLNGPLARLGTVGDIVNAHSDEPMTFGVEGYGETLFYRPQLHAGERHLQLPSPAKLMRNNLLQDALSTISYLGAVRMGAVDAFPIPDQIDFPDIGDDGRFAPYWYHRMADDEIEARRQCADEKSTSFRRQMDAWLGTLFPGAKVNVQYLSLLSQFHLEFSLSELGSFRKPCNVGYGLTYIFPILVALLSAKVGQIIVIDSPESHLHPFAQSQVGVLVAIFAEAGVQIIVETHSDHFLNGVRLAVKNKLVNSDDIRIHFFGGSDAKHHGVTSPSIGASGEIYEWPEGFFDQAEKDLSRLAGWD